MTVLLDTILDSLLSIGHATLPSFLRADDALAFATGIAIMGFLLYVPVCVPVELAIRISARKNQTKLDERYAGWPEFLGLRVGDIARVEVYSSAVLDEDVDGKVVYEGRVTSRNGAWFVGGHHLPFERSSAARVEVLAHCPRTSIEQAELIR